MLGRFPCWHAEENLIEQRAKAPVPIERVSHLRLPFGLISIDHRL